MAASSQTSSREVMLVDRKDLSPDDVVTGFIPGAPDPFRYEGHVLDPDEVAGIFASLLRTTDRVLDVGCGSGGVAKILMDTRGVQVVGVEPDPARAARAAARGVEVHVGYLTSEFITAVGQFDIVLFADVLEHLANPHSLLLKAREALRPGGSIILSVPNVAHWSVRVDLLRGRFTYKSSGIMDATHLRWFTADSLKFLVSSAGFRVTYHRMAAGTTLSDNILRRPFSWLAPNFRSSLLRFTSRRWPNLFGCQHVIKAELT